MRLVVLLAIFILFATMVTADGLPGRVWVIGIKVGVSAEGYQARNDIGVSAGEILTAFKQLQPAATVTYLLSTDNEDNNGVPTRKAIFDLLEIVGRKVAPDDRLIVYIFGQTLEEPAEDEKARQLFIPAGIDTAPEHFIANCIAFNDLLASLKNIACQERLLILDVAPVAKNKLNDPLIPDELISQAANWRVNRSATLFACGAGAFHPEVGAESFFSRTLIAGLNEASNPNTGERNLTILFQYIKEKMTKAGKKAPLLKPENVNFLFPPTEKKTGLINLNISPGEAIVKIKGTDDKEFREWKVGDELALGEYELQFECEGYYPTTQFVTVVYTDDPTPEIVTLKKKTGTLVLVTAPPDIQIFFGEEKTPQKVVNGKITNLPPGPLTVVFRKEGYYSAIKNLDIIAGKDNVINCSLIPLVRLRISASLTIDAEIFLDGESIGKVTPDQPELRSTPLASGKHIVTAKNSDYTSENKEIIIKEEETGEKTIELQVVSKTGTLKISVSGTDILDWRVFIDQDIYEAGELEEPLRLPIGEHYFRVESDGFIPFVQKVTIGVKEEIIDVVLKRSCKIEVITYIPDSVCTIEIANEKIKPMEIRTGIDSVEGSQCWISHFYFSGLPEGRCTILLTRQGFQDVANEVNITPARVNIVKINQQPILNTAVLRVFSNPPDLAIRCNGQSFVNKVAEAGVLVTGVAPGKVTLNANGLADIMTVNNVLPGEIRDVPWEINMPQAQYHTLKLVSSPPKAWVFIDGLIQTKPTNAAGMMTVSKLIAGKHDISIVMPNYYPKHLAIYINDIDIKENVVLEPLPSSLIITTNPINATVELIRINDGQKIEGVNTDGTTYFEDINSQQIYQLMVRGDGFSDQLLPQTLNPGELRTRLITLEPVTTISLNVKPFGLAFEIFVNGIRREMINENKAVYLAELVSVDPIPVEVMLCAPDYRSQCWLINIKGGESLPLNVTMVKDPANPFEIRTNIKDRAEIVWVPSGMFTMGNNDDETARPIHNVSLSGFWIYRDEVSVKDFKVFWVEKNYSSKRFPKLPNGWLETYPMVNVTWEQAKEYAEWAGGDLPTEAQWEYAARGDDERIFPWGNDWNGAYCLNPMIKHLSPMPTGTSSEKDVSPSGVRDMAGNVAEWCADYFDEEYYLNSPRFNPQGPETKGRQRSVRGGAWYSWKKRNELFCRTYARSGMPPNFADDWIGFRVVKDGPTE